MLKRQWHAQIDADVDIDIAEANGVPLNKYWMPPPVVHASILSGFAEPPSASSASIGNDDASGGSDNMNVAGMLISAAAGGEDLNLYFDIRISIFERHIYSLSYYSGYLGRRRKKDDWLYDEDYGEVSDEVNEENVAESSFEVLSISSDPNALDSSTQQQNVTNVRKGRLKIGGCDSKSSPVPICEAAKH